MGKKGGDDESVPLIQGIAAKVKNIEGVIKSMHPTLQSKVNELGHGSPKSATRVTFEPKLWFPDLSTNVEAELVNNVALRDKGHNQEAELFNNVTLQEPKADAWKDSFAAKLQGPQPKQKVNFRFLENKNGETDVDVTIPIASVKVVQERYKNVLYGYFLGKRLAFPVVDYFVKNKWKKYGIQKCMMNARGFFFFKFSSKEGCEQVLKDGPWLIKNIPLFLKEWSPNSDLKKEELKKVPVWVKMHDVPISAYTEDGLSLLGSKLGSPKMVDNETANMCAESWGKSSFARGIIELDADKELKDSISIAVPNLEEGGFMKSIVRVEYEWSPPRCSTCCVFGHTDTDCPKRPQPNAELSNKGKDKADDDGFIDAHPKKKGFHVKEKPKVVYKPKHNEAPPKGNASKSQSGNSKGSTSKDPSQVHLQNSFEKLGFEDEDEVYDTYDTIPSLLKDPGASTPKTWLNG